MARFIRTEGRLVNLDHVVSAEAPEHDRVTLLLSNGDEVTVRFGKTAVTTTHEDRLRDALQPQFDPNPPIVPAAPGTIAALILADVFPFGDKPGEVEASTTLVPVIGWRVHDWHNEPILPDPYNFWIVDPLLLGRHNTASIYIKTPDSNWCNISDDGAVAKTLEDAEKWTCLEEQRRRARSDDESRQLPGAGDDK